MNKFLTKIIGASLAFAMMIGGAVGINAAKEATEVNAEAYSGTFERATITDLTAGDVVLIVNNNNKAMSNNNGASSAPSATGVTVSNNKISNPDTNLIWTFGKSGDNYTFRAGTSGNNYLYCTNANNGVRVGTNANKEFTVDGGYLKNVATSRYVGVYNNSDWRCYTSSGGNIASQTFSYFKLAQSSFGTLHHIKVNAPASKLVFEVGETFTSSGLTLIGYDGENEETAHTQTYTSGYTTSLDGYTFVEGDIGTNKTVTVTYSGKTTTYTIDVNRAPDFIIDGDTNSIDNFSDNTENTDVAEGQVNSTGVKYGYYAMGLFEDKGEKFFEFNKTIQGAYIGNNETYGKYIQKIRVTLRYDNNFNKIKMYEGDSAIPETTEIEATELAETQRMYNFSGNTEYFSLKQMTTGSWVAIRKIEVFLGLEVPVVDTVVASVKDGTYYAGATLSASNFNITVNWTAGKEATHPTEGFTWKINGVLNGVLNEGDNSVVVTYQEVNSEAFNVIGSPATARDVIENALVTQTQLSYRYSKNVNSKKDELDKAFTGRSGTSYGNWDGTSNSSGITYKGNSAAGNDSIQLRSSDNAGVVVTANASHRKALKITISWESHTANNRTVDVYGKDAAYTAASNLYSSETRGTLLGSLKHNNTIQNDVTSLTINGDYEYIGFKSNDGALYMSNVEIEWSDTVSYSFSDISIRFGGNVTKDLWNRLDSESTITGFGVMVTESKNVENFDEFKTYIESDMFESSENSEDYSKDIVDYYIPVASMASVIGENANNYFWNLRLDIDEANMNKTYSAIAYIKINDGYALMNMATESVKTLALDYLTNRGCNETTAGGSLQAIADNAQ